MFNNTQILEICEYIAGRQIESPFIKSMAIDDQIRKIAKRDGIGISFGQIREAGQAVELNLKYYEN